MKNKGISIMVAYVLLVVIAISLALIVYAWLKSVIPGETKECPDDMFLVASDYECYSDDSGQEFINISFDNKGLFTIDGFYIKGATEENKLAIHLLKDTETNIEGNVRFPQEKGFEPGEKIWREFLRRKLENTQFGGEKKQKTLLNGKKREKSHK